MESDCKFWALCGFSTAVLQCSPITRLPTCGCLASMGHTSRSRTALNITLSSNLHLYRYPCVVNKVYQADHHNTHVVREDRKDRI